MWLHVSTWRKLLAALISSDMQDHQRIHIDIIGVGDGVATVSGMISVIRHRPVCVPCILRIPIDRSKLPVSAKFWAYVIDQSGRWAGVSRSIRLQMSYNAQTRWRIFSSSTLMYSSGRWQRPCQSWSHALIDHVRLYLQNVY